MKIKKSLLPEKSSLNIPTIHYDFIDSYQGEIADPKNQLQATAVGKAFFSSAPNWVSQLFEFRNKIVAVFGLKTANKMSNREALLSTFKCEVGEQLGLFKVFNSNENEVILGENDKHLDFRISLFLEPIEEDAFKKTITISTTVIFHNKFGKIYFLPVKPFHKRIVPVMLKGIIKHLEQSINP
jgi:hypothetical protein